MFDGFELDDMDLGEVVLRVRHGGEGPPVVLLHGHPRTHATWHRVAARLAPRHAVVCPDLRGYGRSTLPPDQPNHGQSSKRAMAADVVAAMRRLGHPSFAVVGHDRGGLVAMRAALDHPQLVTRLAIMDALPVVEHLERLNEDFVRNWWHWWFMGQTEKPAERVICADPDAWYETPGPEAMGAQAHAELWEALRDPAVVHGMCEDYRAGLRIDRMHEEADRAARRRVACPMLFLQAACDDIDMHGDPVTIWHPWVSGSLSAAVIDSGHHQAEEAPDAVAAALSDFLAEA
jgi:haloacetate dehalogenase